MLSAIKQFFESNLLPDGGGARDPQQAIHLAVAVLLLEVAESDYEDHPGERDAIVASIRSQFGLSDKEAEELVQLAAAEHASSTDYFQFTSLINQHYQPEEKIKIVEGLWQTAFADGHLHHYEEHVIRKLADLLHIPHREFIAAKHRVSRSA